MADQFTAAEQNIIQAEKRIEGVFKLFWNLIYKLFDLVAGMLEPIANFLGFGKEDEQRERYASPF